jgi:iron(III) transport system ATP-binding protein
MANLNIQELTKTFGLTKAVNNLSLDILDGEAVVLLGPSGCGKTTLLKLIAGFLNPNNGKISFGEKVLSTPYEVYPPDRRNMSMVFQSYAIWPHKTVFQNVSYGLEVRKVKKTDIQQKVKEALSIVHLDGLEGRYSTELSGGQQQRVALARAIVIEPSILLLDEPLSNLDANLRVQMRSELADLHKRLGITFVYVTHDQEEAMVLGDRIVLMNHGEIIQQGVPEDLYQRPNSEFAASFIGTSNLFSGEMIGDSHRDLVSLKTEIGNMIIDKKIANSASSFERMMVCIRPEWIKMHSDPPSATKNTFEAKVLKKEYYGKHKLYTVEINNKEIKVETGLSPDFPEGAEITIELPPERCVCLNNNGKEGNLSV